MLRRKGVALDRWASFRALGRDLVSLGVVISSDDGNRGVGVGLFATPDGSISSAAFQDELIIMVRRRFGAGDAVLETGDDIFV